jgi:hypothetical protein
MNHRPIGACVWEPRAEISKRPFNAAGSGRFSLKTSVEGKGEDAMKLGHSTEGVHSPAT